MAKVRYLGIGEETTPGTAASAAVYLPIESESIAPTHGMIDVETIRDRIIREQILGKFRNAGDIKTPFFPSGLTKLLKWALGSVETTTPDGATNARLHTFSVADELKTFTARIGVELMERQIVACQVNTVEIASSIADGILGATFGIIGGEETKQTIGTPSWLSDAELKPLVPFGASVKIGGTEKQAEVEALVVRLNNNIPDRWTHEGRFEKRAAAGKLEVTGTLDLIFPNTTQYDNFLAGTDFSLVYKAEGDEIESGFNYYLEINMPKCRYQENVVPHLSKRDELKISGAPFKVMLDESSDYAIKIMVQNKETSI